MGGQTHSPFHFQNSSKNYFTSIPSDEDPGTENPGSLGIKAIFCPILDNDFFQNHKFFFGLVGKI